MKNIKLELQNIFVYWKLHVSKRKPFASKKTLFIGYDQPR